MPDISDTTPPKQMPTGNPLAGIGWMILTGFLFVAVTAVVKHGAQNLPAAQSAFLRYAIGLVFVIPMLNPMRDAHLTNRQLKLFCIRGLAHTFGVILWFYAMTRITIAEVTAMNYMTPVYVTLGAALFLGERVAMRRLIAVLVAFVGALIVLRPGVRELGDGHLAMVGTALVFSVSYLTAKMMSDEVPASVVVGMLSITVTIGLAPFAFLVWQPPSAAEVGWMAVIAVLATAGHYTMTLAFAAAPVSITQPVTFLQLIWSVAIGVLLFSEPIDGWVILGGVVIIASTTFIAIREAMLRRAANSEKEQS